MRKNFRGTLRCDGGWLWKRTSRAEARNCIYSKQIEEIDMREVCVREFIEQAKAYVEMEKLTPEILRVFVKKIEVYEKPEKYFRTAGNPIIIHFTFQPHRNTDFFTMSFNEEILDALQAQTA